MKMTIILCAIILPSFGDRPPGAALFLYSFCLVVTLQYIRMSKFQNSQIVGCWNHIRHTLVGLFK